MLSDQGILAAIDSGAIAVDPFDPSRLQPASIDLTLSPDVRWPNSGYTRLDVANLPEGHTVADPFREIAETQGILLMPGAVLLACTAETVRLGRMHVGRVEGKSSLARLWLSVHVTGGFIDPGFEGQVTLEVVNHAPWALMLHPGMPICQIAFDRLDTMPRKTYERTGRYQGQAGPTESRFTIGARP